MVFRSIPPIKTRFLFEEISTLFLLVSNICTQVLRKNNKERKLSILNPVKLHGTSNFCPFMFILFLCTEDDFMVFAIDNNSKTDCVLF